MVQSPAGSVEISIGVDDAPVWVAVSTEVSVTLSPPCHRRGCSCVLGRGDGVGSLFAQPCIHVTCAVRYSAFNLLVSRTFAVFPPKLKGSFALVQQHG